MRLAQLLPDLGSRTLVMGILNVTPDSFSDGGDYFARNDAVQQGLRMLDDGADIIDVGGESTRPGAPEVDETEELRRVIPAITGVIERRPDAVISIDTTKARVAREAVAAGATLVNDVSGLSFDEAMAETVASLAVPVIVMHIQGTPRTMQDDPSYDDVVDDIREHLSGILDRAAQAGIDRTEIVVDPGFGFGKTVAHNLEILRRLNEFRELGAPILIGTSRKSFIGKLTDRALPADRVHGTSATHAIAIANGADVLRVHDVAAAVDVARVADAITRG